MIKKLILAAGTLLVTGVLALFAVGSVFAQTPTPPSSTPQTPLGNAWGQVCNGAGIVSNAITNLLGMTPQQIYAERSAGKTLSEIAREKGVTDQQLIDAMLAGHQEAISLAVKDGRITQSQADWMLTQMKTMAPLQLSKPFGPGGMGRMHGGGYGPRGGGTPPWAQDAPAAP